MTIPTRDESTDDGSPIEAYLDQLLTASLPGRPREVRRLLDETESHLLDAAAAAEARGLTRQAAERDAVARFGPAVTVAGDDQRVDEMPWSEVGRQCITSGLLLGSLACLAVGLSGLIAAVMQAAAGRRFLVDLPSGTALSASNCSRWLAGATHPVTCAQAGLADWAAETVVYRLVVGMLGLLGILGFMGLRRRWSRSGQWTSLPRTVVDTIAVVAFGAAGLWLAASGIDRVTASSGHGAGQWLSAAPVALGCAVVYGLRLLHDLRGQTNVANGFSASSQAG